MKRLPSGWSLINKAGRWIVVSVGWTLQAISWVLKAIGKALKWVTKPFWGLAKLALQTAVVVSTIGGIVLWWAAGFPTPSRQDLTSLMVEMLVALQPNKSTTGIITFANLTPEERRLVAAAMSVSNEAYCPYSKFPVGAAVRAQNAKGERKVFVGCNVENASYGLTSCAERNAIYAAVGAGYRQIDLVAVYCANAPGGSPCGVCRQVIREFGRDADVLMVKDEGSVNRRNLSLLLPDSFGPESLESTTGSQSP